MCWHAKIYSIKTFYGQLVGHVIIWSDKVSPLGSYHHKKKNAFHLRRKMKLYDPKKKGKAFNGGPHTIKSNFDQRWDDTSNPDHWIALITVRRMPLVSSKPEFRPSHISQNSESYHKVGPTKLNDDSRPFDISNLDHRKAHIKTKICFWFLQIRS